MPKGSGSRHCGEKENRTWREGARQANVTHKASQSRSGWRPGGRLFGSWNNIYFEFCVRIVCRNLRILRFGKTTGLTCGRSAFLF